MAFEYSDGRITPHSLLPEALKSKAVALIELCGLDNEPGHPDRKKRPSSKDKLWLRRTEIWAIAQRDLQRPYCNDSVEVRELIIENAVARGLFSVWMEVFKDDMDMRQCLINAFPGTAADCFDTHCKAIARPGGKI